MSETRRGSIGKIRYEQRVSRLFIGFLLLIFILVVRLFILQIHGAGEFRAAIANDRRVTTRLPARRGNIVDRLGRPLATTVETYDLGVLPAYFREHNRIDALGDLSAAWVPDVSLSVRRSESLVERANDRARRLLSIHDRRLDLVARLFACPADSRVMDSRALGRRFEWLQAPTGELLLTTDQLPARVRRALVLLSDHSDGDAARKVQEGLRSGWPLRRILGRSQAEVAALIEQDMSQLSTLADLAGLESVEAFFVSMAQCEIQEARAIDRRIEGLVDDHIALDRLGTFSPGRDLSSDELDELAADLDVPLVDPSRLADGVKALLDQSPPAEKVVAKVTDVLAGRRVSQLEVFERRALSRILGLHDARPEFLLRRLGEQVRQEDGYRRDAFLSPRKERLRRIEFKNWSPRRLATGCSFEVARRVWNLFGLAQLGFRVTPRHGREYWRDSDGVAALVVGRVSRSAVALNGLERSLEGDLGTLGGGTVSIGGEDGSALLERQFDGRLAELNLEKQPVQGALVTLTLDRELQAEVEEALIEMVHALASGSDAAGGGACLLDIRSGEILALASVPRLPGDRFVEELENERSLRSSRRAVELAFADGEMESSDWRMELASLKALLDRRVLVDRASNAGEHGYYPPGSVMKVFSALCMLKDNVMDPDETLVCSTRKYHGPMNMHSALVQSCNAYFWSASKEIGRDRLVHCFEQWGLFSEVPFLLSESGVAARRSMIQGDSAKNLVIGQGSLSTSPLEVACMMSNLGRFGERIVPRIVKRMGDREVTARRLPRIEIERRHVDRVLQGMRGVYEKYEGRDARLAPFVDLRICGKTGTAEGYVGKQAEDNIAWFAGVAPFEAPRFAFAVFVEHTKKKGRHVIPHAAAMVRLCAERCR